MASKPTKSADDAGEQPVNPAGQMPSARTSNPAASDPNPPGKIGRGSATGASTARKPDDHLANSDAIAPPDEFESPHEQSIVSTNPHRDLAPEEHESNFNEFKTEGDPLDLHQLHGHAAPSGMSPETLGMPVRQAAPEKFRPVPWWAIAASAGLLMWGGMYLGQYNGGFQADVFNETANYHPVIGPPPDPNSPDALTTAGEKVFTQNCVQCHQTSGLGVAGQWPPLVASEWVVGDAPKRLQQILLHGIQGTIHVKGQVYNNNMPAWNAVLTDKAIAQVLTYVRHKLGGNSAEPITEAQMASARKLTDGHSDPWTEQELLAMPAGPIDGGGAPAADATKKAATAPGPGQNPPTDSNGTNKPAAGPAGQGPST